VGQEDVEGNNKIKQEVEEDKSTVRDTSGVAGTSKSGTKEQSQKKTARQYRKRRNSSSDSEKDENKKAKFNTNVDADSDFTGHSSGSDSDNEETETKTQEDKDTAREGNKPEVLTSGSEEGEIRETNCSKVDSERQGNLELTRESASEGDKLKHDESEGKEEGKNNADEKADKGNISEKPEPQKRSIWEKRTVGPIFEAALERYFVRKAAKSAG
jgi:coiled-coil domain-containing protein 55